MLGITELKWIDMSQFNSEEHGIYYSGHGKHKTNGIVFICDKSLKKCILGFNPVRDRIISNRLQCKPTIVTVVPKHQMQKMKLLKTFMKMCSGPLKITHQAMYFIQWLTGMRKWFKEQKMELLESMVSDSEIIEERRW